MAKETQIETRLIEKLQSLGYTYHDDIRDRNTLEYNFRQKFEALNRVHLTDSEFDRLLEEIVNPDVFTSSKRLRERNTFQREDGTPLQYTLVNIRNWCKNEYEVVNQLRINTKNSNQRYDVILLINGIPAAQIELKTLDVSPRRAMQQIVDYKNEPGNGYANTLLCFMQLFIVSNQTNTYYFANNQNQHFSFNADEQFLPIYQLASEDNKKITKQSKRFSPNAQLFGFTGTPIFDENSTHITIDGEQASNQTTKDIFQKQLHAYTITHAIDDKNVLRFHIDYFKAEGNYQVGESSQAVVDAILSKHDAATNSRRFNALLATSSINNAIEYYHLFKKTQEQRKAEDDTSATLSNHYQPLNIACVFSPPAYGNPDVKQIQEDLPQEKADNEQEPDAKKKALEAIITDYNRQYGTNHSIYNFDLYYQDVQTRIKDQKYSNADLPHAKKIDIVIVVDMLLTGFDSKYLNTLYVDKDLKYHGLIQAFSRTNRILNDTKPYGNILDFRKQKNAVDEAIALFSGEDTDRAKEIWLVDPAPVVIEKYKEAVAALGDFMNKNNLLCEPQEVYNLRGDATRIAFVRNFKEVQRLKTQLDQYTDLNQEQKDQIEVILPDDILRSFRSSYIETAKQFKEIQQKEGDRAPDEVKQLDFEFVLFASTLVDYDYIMSLIANNMKNKNPAKQKRTQSQVISLLSSNSNLMDEQEDLTDYIQSLDWNSGQNEKKLREGYQTFKDEKIAAALSATTEKYGLETTALQAFVERIMSRMIFDGEQLSDLLAPLELGWKARTQQELALMDDLMPLLKKLAAGRDISGLSAYE